MLRLANPPPPTPPSRLHSALIRPQTLSYRSCSHYSVLLRFPLITALSPFAAVPVESSSSTQQASRSTCLLRARHPPPASSATLRVLPASHGIPPPADAVRYPDQFYPQAQAPNTKTPQTPPATMYPRHEEAAMSGMDMDMDSNSTSMSASMMSMTFFTSSKTSLYSALWTPSSPGEYAGTCIFLILLAVIFRSLLAVKQWKETAWMDAEFNRRYVTVAGKQPKSERISQDADTKRMTLTENGVEEDVMVVKKRSMGIRPWRITTDPVRAFLDTVIAGVGYLLMLAVMTMNVGYFLSVLGGTFLGSLAFGRYVTSEH
ncbi:hypothetical protein PZA11_001425 [Diplocarpon coronariae]